MLENLMAYVTATFIDVTEREDGQTLVEYALILALVSILSILALGVLSGAINGLFNTISTAL